MKYQQVYDVDADGSVSNSNTHAHTPGHRTSQSSRENLDNIHTPPKKRRKKKDVNISRFENGNGYSASDPCDGGTANVLDAVRISIGDNVYHTGCKLTLMTNPRTPSLLIEYKAELEQGNERKTRSRSRNNLESRYHNIYLNESGFNDIHEMKYFVVDDGSNLEDEGTDTIQLADDGDIGDQISFLALRITPNPSMNNLPDELAESENGYVVIEVRNNEEFTKVLDRMKKFELLNGLLNSLSMDSTAKYLGAMKKETQKDLARRDSAPPKRASKNNEVVLVYPFNASRQELKKVADHFPEANGQKPTFNDLNEKEWSKPSTMIENEEAGKTVQSNRTLPSDRTHLLTIVEEDCDRLEPDGFLNDRLVDFWMKW